MKRVHARSAQPEAAIAAEAAAAIGIGDKATRITPRRPLRLAGVDFGLPWNAGKLGLQLQAELFAGFSLLLIGILCAAVIHSGGAREIKPVRRVPRIVADRLTRWRAAAVGRSESGAARPSSRAFERPHDN